VSKTYKIKVISSTTRPGRKGTIIGNWITSIVSRNSAVQVEFLDLGEVNLPMMNEPYHPRLKKYEHEHTKRWSAKIDEADAYIFVIAEYNHSFPAPLKNALDYVLQEWAYKPAGFVSYGGVSGGTRAVNMIKPTISALGMMAIPEAVNIPFFTNFINEKEEFMPSEQTLSAAQNMLKELLKWTETLEQLREQK